MNGSRDQVVAYGGYQGGLGASFGRHLTHRGG
jgi:hypothetical protein